MECISKRATRNIELQKRLIHNGETVFIQTLELYLHKQFLLINVKSLMRVEVHKTI